MTEDGEDDETSEDGCRAVGDRNNHGVTEAVVLELVVGGESYETAPRGTEGVEDLNGSILPYLNEMRNQWCNDYKLVYRLVYGHENAT